MTAQKIFSFLFPRQSTVSHRERLLSCLGGIAAISITAWVSHLYLGPVTDLFLLAAMGASTVLLLGAPHSPFSQPWPLVGGHMVSAVIGVTCATYLHNIHLSAGLAVGLSILAMYYLRCIHPPGGATALLAVVGDQRIHSMGYHFVLLPVLANVAILLSVSLLINKFALRRHYPYNLSLPQKGISRGGDRATTKLVINEDDLAAALKEMNSYIDVTGEDLEKIYALAALHSHQRRLGDIRLKDIMSPEVITVKPDQPLEEIWNLLRSHHIRGVPVTDKAGEIVGMVAIADFLKLADWRMCNTLVARMKFLVSRKKINTAEQIMTSPVIVGHKNMPMTEAFLLFAKNGINHLPIVDDEGELVGILTRLDLLSALYVNPAAIAPGYR